MRRWTQIGKGARRVGISATCLTAGMLLAATSGLALAQANPAPAPPAIPGQASGDAPQQAPVPIQSAPGGVATPQQASGQDANAAAAGEAKAAKLPRGGDRRRAAKLYLSSSKQFESGQFEAAMEGYQQAAKLDPSNANYALAAEVARGHAVTALIQDATKARLRGDAGAARVALVHANEMDPGNALVTEHLYQLRDDVALMQTEPRYAQTAATVGEDIALLAPSAGTHSFHIHSNGRQVIQQVFKAYDIDVTFDDSVRSNQVRLDLDDATFAQAIHTVEMLTGSFYVTLDAHRALVARDSRDNRQQFTRLDFETIYLSGLGTAELTEVGALAKAVFDAQLAVTQPSAGTITIRAPAATLRAFNATMRDLLEGHNQVMLDIRLIQVAHVGGRNTGITPPQTFSAFNFAAEAKSILAANQALVQQIISSGLAAPGDTLAILGILLASGQVTSPLFANGIATFGGGLTKSGLSLAGVKLNLSLNSSDTRELDRIQLRLGDGEDGTLREGSRYPIQTSSFSSLAGSVPNIPGLTGAGNSSGLSGLLSSLEGAVPNLPQVEYQDLGLTLKATPRVMRNGNVALTMDMKIDSLAGSAINGNPILNNRSYSGVITLKAGEAAVLVSDLDKLESRAISGTPGLSEIPGLNDLTDKDVHRNYASLLLIITPHVIRGTQAAGHSPMMRVVPMVPAR